MTEQELERLAGLIADALARSSGRRESPARESWVPTPVRPEPSVRGGEPPVWSGAAQRLGDGTTARDGDSGSRQPIGEMTNATRAAAAGRGPARRTPLVAGRASIRTGARGTLSIAVTVGVSNRHVHLSPEHFRALFGTDAPSVLREISQPGQFAAKETVAAIGPKGTLDAVRVVGPARGETQLELSIADARSIGADVFLAASGKLKESPGGVTLRGPAGEVKLTRGVIVAARHLHLAPADASRWGFADGDRLDIRVGQGARATTFHDVLVRSGPTHVTEIHLDLDEANAAGLTTGDQATIIARVAAGRAARRVLVTEREILSLAQRGAPLPANALLTPSARDRAKSLGLLTE